MNNLLFVVVVACVCAVQVQYTDEDCLDNKIKTACESQTTPKCAWYDNYYGRKQCLLPCNDDIVNVNNSGNENDSTAYVDVETGSDTNNGLSVNSPLKTIEQVKKCFGHNTNTILIGNSSYELTPPANLSWIRENVVPFFFLEGDNPGEGDPSTTIEVKDADYDLLGISGIDRASVICYVNKAIFKMTYMIVNVLETNRSFDHSTLLWLNDYESIATFNKVNFIGDDFPEHMFIHTGGTFELTSVKIIPMHGGRPGLPGNIIYWHGSDYNGTWTLNDFQIKGSSSIEYSYDKSLFEQKPGPGGCDLVINLENSTFENIKWKDFSSSGLKRQKNQEETVPVGLALTVTSINRGRVRVINTSFTKLDVSEKPFAAPLAIASVPVRAEAAPLFDFLNFTDNTGNSAGAIASNANYSIGNSIFKNNMKVDADPVTGKSRGASTAKANDLAALADNVFVNLDDFTKDNGVNIDNRMHIAGEEDEFPVYAMAIIIAVGVVVVAAIVVIVSCAVYYRKKKYSTLSDEEYDESSSSSLRSSEKENEMDSA